MTILYRDKKAFEYLKHYLEVNQYLFTYEITNGIYKVRIEN